MLQLLFAWCYALCFCHRERRFRGILSLLLRIVTPLMNIMTNSNSPDEHYDEQYPTLNHKHIFIIPLIFLTDTIFTKSWVVLVQGGAGAMWCLCRGVVRSHIKVLMSKLKTNFLYCIVIIIANLHYLQIYLQQKKCNSSPFLYNVPHSRQLNIVAGAGCTDVGTYIVLKNNCWCNVFLINCSYNFLFSIVVT